MHDGRWKMEDGRWMYEQINARWKIEYGCMNTEK